ncbi:MAG: hypothetical protein IJV01_04965 [Bacteroidales bacterium]|nr:hypothetical protein [Bacteroidales bacterium]
MKKIWIIVVGCLILCACSVKEDRSACPCWLEVELRGGAERTVEVSVWAGSLVCSAEALLQEGQAREELEIPRGRLRVSAFSGVHGCLRSGEALSVPEGGEMDELYADASSLDARSDLAKTALSLHKQFVRLHMGIVGSDSSASPFRIEVQGAVAGFSLSSLQPVPGAFRVSLTPVIGTYHRVVLPRQRPGDVLNLVFYGHGDGPAAAPRAVYPLGERLEQLGFDWMAADLDDVYLDIDYAEAGITLRLLDWEKEEVI